MHGGVLNKVLFMADSFAIVRRAACAFSFTGAAVGYEQRMSGMAEGGRGGGKEVRRERDS